jgi:LacI family transcriptional regulator
MEKMKRVTLREIAEAADVSVATVDRVLNRRPGVRTKTRNKVENAIHSLRNHGSREKGRQLKDLKIAAVLQTSEAVADGYCRLIPRVAAELGLRKEIAIRIFNDEGPREVADSLQEISAGVDGIIFSARSSELINERLNTIIDAGTQVVCITSDLPTTQRHCYVGMDQVMAGRLVGRLLGMCCAPDDGVVVVHIGRYFRCEHERETGFRSILREHYPHLRTLDLLNLSATNEEANSLIENAIREGIRIAGIYSPSAGLAGIAAALSNHFEDDTRPYLVGHEFFPTLKQLLLDDRLDALIATNNIDVIKTAINALAAVIAGRKDTRNQLRTPHIIFRENAELLEWY